MLQILEVAIGLAFVFTLVSLACSAVNEWISGILGRRGRLLWQAIGTLLGSELQGRMESSQLFQGLRHETWFDRLFRRIAGWYDRSQPSYVTTPGFVLTLLSAVSPGGIPQTTADLKAAIAAQTEVPEKVRDALLALVEEAGEDLTHAKENLGHWFDAAMNALAGRYKRWSQQILFVLGFLAAVGLGIDAVAIGQKLWADGPMREAVVSSATKFIKDQPAPPATTAPAAAAAQDGQKPKADPATQAMVKRLNGLQSELLSNFDFALTPYRPDGQDKSKDQQHFWTWFGSHFFGFLLTGLAASLGGPFWFDLLNRLVDLRLAGKKPDPGPAKP